jgi:hypothetical protein
MTRPDIAVNVAMLSGVVDATVQHIINMNKIVKYLKSTKGVPLEMKRIKGGIKSPQILCFSDAALNNLQRGGSQGGSMIFITEKTEIGKDRKAMWLNASLISWKSSRIKRVVTCTMSSELLQQSSTFDSGMWLKNLCSEIFGCDVGLHLRTDCLSIIANINSMRTQIKEKRLLNEVFILKEAWERNEISSYEHVPTKLMIADGLTKPDMTLKELITKAMRNKIRIPSDMDRGDKQLQYNVSRPRWSYE